MRLPKNPAGFSGKKLAVCCAHNLPTGGGKLYEAF